MAYAISEEDAAKAPKVSDGEDTYVKEQLLKGSKYYLYAHSYLNYGLLAGRAEIFKAIGSSGNPCILTGYDGFETVTYMLQADFTHQGFAGLKGTIKNLDVKWMSA